MTSTAADRWRHALGDWALPPEILDQAPVSPWSHDPSSFVVDDTLERDTAASQMALVLLEGSDGVVLDVGCGGGRASLPLLPTARELVGVDESPVMLEQFAAAAEGAGVAHREIRGRWPEIASSTPIADVVVCHHVFYNVADLVPFATALTEHAHRGVVVVLPPRHPLSPWNETWRHFWDLERPEGPTADDALDVLVEMGLEPRRIDAPRGALARSATDPTAMVASVRRRLCLHETRDREIAAYLANHPPRFFDEVAVLSWSGTAPR